MSRRIVVVLGTLSLLLLASPARADVGSCLQLDPNCLDDIVATDPDEALDDRVGSVVDLVDGAEDTTDPVLDVVDPVVPPGGEGPGAHDGGPGQEVDRRERSRQDPGSPAAGPRALVRETFAPPETIIGSAATGIDPPLAPRGSPGRFDGFVEGAVRGLLLLTVLFGLTVGFVMVQGRMDRNDPKLIAAPVRTEVVTFG